MKKFLLPILALASVVQVSAKVIDPAHALARAQGATRSGQSLSDYKLQSTVNTDSGEAGVYLFSDGTSSLILSADDSTPAVLGILDQAIPEKIDNPQFLYWINMYASQIDWQRKNSVFATLSDDDAPKKEIKPLLTTKWDQVSPYNDRSPEVNGKKSWAGCVATAMSQVMQREKVQTNIWQKLPTSNFHATFLLSHSTGLICSIPIQAHLLKRKKML